MENFTYGTTLKKIRKDMKLSQKDVSEKICSQAMLSRIENNDVIPNVLIMQQLCTRLDKSIDDILNYNEKVEQYKHSQAQELLTLISFYHSTEQYAQLNELITKKNLLELFSNDLQLQAYTYYKACLLSYYDSDSVYALSLFEKSLGYTYKKNNNSYFSNMEIMIMCELACHYLNNANLPEGLYFVEQILRGFDHSVDYSHYELVRSLFNVSVSLINQNQLELASTLIDTGINWAKENKIYYYLDQLFFLKGSIIQDLQNINEAIDLVKRASQVRLLASLQ